MAKLMTQAQVMAMITECEAQMEANRALWGAAVQQRHEHQLRIDAYQNEHTELVKAREALDAMRLVLIMKGTG